MEHRHAGRLQCHHCGYQARLPEACPACGTAGSFAACGPGVERLAEETAALFPAARIALLTSDTLGGPRAVALIIDRILRHEVDLLIGTQIVAKGHHFPMLTLVGVVDADLGLQRRRSARGGAHLSAAAPGGGPRRARRAAGPGAAADLSIPRIP